MSLYVLDTDILVLYGLGNGNVVSRVLCTTPSDIATTVITVEEQLSGWYTLIRKAKSASQLALAYQQLANNVKLLRDFNLLSFTELAIEQFNALRQLKVGVKHTDLRIAAIAITHGAVMVTRNVRDFATVPGLTIEDWSQ